MATTKTVTGEMTINEAIKERPETVAIFHRLGLDSCCGGGLPIRVAAERHVLDPEEVLRLLNAEPATG
jgi:regulator of cell morphogenesis and NO signaling